MEGVPSFIKKGIVKESTDVMDNVVTALTTKSNIKRRNLYGADAANCPRKASIIMNLPADHETEFSASGALYMAIGSAVHETLQSALKKSGVLLVSEYRISGFGISLGGYVDAIIMLNGRPRILEIKTCGNTLPAKPKPEHVVQAQTYALVTGILDPIILYVSRSVAGYDGKIISRQFDIDSDRDTLSLIATRLFRSQYYAEAKVLADIPSHIANSRDCGFCAFTEMCWTSHVPYPIDPPSKEQKAELELRVAESAQKAVADIFDGKNVRYEETTKRLRDLHSVILPPLE